MSEKIFLVEQFSKLLQKNWASILDKNLFMKRVLSDAQNANLVQKIVQDLPPRQVKISITKFEVPEYDPYGPPPIGFNLWTEFTIPRGQGVVVGTNVYFLSLDGRLNLNEAYGVFFVPKSESNDV